ncbi:MAG: class I SAM-dependent RNA methyltransferase [Pleomorphochaeta sp.]
MQVTISKMAQGGEGIASLESGRTVFVDGALVDEVVEIEVYRETKSYAKAKITNIIKASKDRVEPFCPHYFECGGCNLQHLKYDKQVKLKEELVFDHLKRIAKLDLSKIKILPTETDSDTSYRNRVRFHVSMADKKVGFLKKQSDELCQIDNCPLLVDSINEAIDNGEILKAARMNMFNNNTRGQYIQVPVFAGDDKLSFSKDRVKITINEHLFSVSANVFFQSNPKLLSKLVDYVVSKIDSDSVMDLYSGVGTFSAFLPKNTIAVEKQRDCLTLSKINAPNAISYTGEVEKWGKKNKESVDIVVVDPPRTGLYESVPKLIKKFGTKKIIYVSCNPVTLARDIKEFVKLGYEVKEVKVFDFYPHTHHVESVVILKSDNLY